MAAISKRDQVLSPRVVEDMIANGHTIVIFEDLVLKLDAWLTRHPGGGLAIQHMVGRDATAEMKAYHKPKDLKTMKAFRIGRKPPGLWKNHTPPIRGGVFRKLDDIPPSPTPTPTPLVVVEDVDVDDEDSSCLSDSASDRSARSVPTSLSSIDSRVEAASKVAPGYEVFWRSSDDPTVTTKVFQGDAAAYTAWAEQRDADLVSLEFPPVDPIVQEDIAKKYSILAQRVHDEGFYTCHYSEYAKEATRYTLLFTLSMTALYHHWYMTSACFLGLFWHQLMFSAHDAGHRAITGNFVVDTLIGMWVADFCCGLSLGWWKRSHNVHHLITNHPEHDPDIQNIPLFATSPSFFRGVFSSYYDFSFVWDAAADFLVPFQAYTYYPIMGVARFNLYLLSWLHLLSSKSSSLGNSSAWWIRPAEITMMSCYWYIFGYLLVWCTLPTWPIRIGFVLISHIITMPLHVQITLSHWAMSTSDLGESESFAQRQLRTTMDVDCPAWLDWFHGGLQFQAVHHLFPRVPRHNLRRLQALVMEFCAETGIPYTLLGFVDGNKKVLGRLDEVGVQVKHLVRCQKYMAETGESGLH